MKKKVEKEKVYCDDCAYAAYDQKFENMSLDGKPTLIICPFKEWKIVVGSVGCDNFTRRKTA